MTTWGLKVRVREAGKKLVYMGWVLLALYIAGIIFFTFIGSGFIQIYVSPIFFYPLMAAALICVAVGAALAVRGDTTLFIGDEQITEEIMKLIEATEKELIVVSPWIAPTGYLIDKVFAAIGRGIELTVVTRYYDDWEDDQRRNIYDLYYKGAAIHLDAYVHAKMFIADRKRLILSSANVTHTSLTRNHEVGVWTRDSAQVEDALDYCRNLIGGLRKFVPKSRHSF